MDRTLADYDYNWGACYNKLAVMLRMECLDEEAHVY